jgi:hypothetical protein
VIGAFCAAARACCPGQGFSIAGLTDCEAQFPIRQPAFASVSSGAVTVDAAGLASCLAAYRDAATSCVRNTVIPACANVFVGTKAENQPCANLFECRRDQGPATCYKVQSGNVPPETGTCRRIRHGTSGAPCSSNCQNGEHCSSESISGEPFPDDTFLTYCFEADGLYCPLGDDTPTCRPIIAAGSACEFDGVSCGSAAYCDATCQSRRALGQTCQFTSECAKGLLCTDEHRCVEDPFASEGVCMGYSLGP